MAVAYDVNTTSSVITEGATGGSSSTGSVTVSASATIAIAFAEESLGDGVSDANITGEGASKPDFAGVAGTLISGSKKHSGSDSDVAGYVQLWSLLSPATGASRSGSWAPTFSGGGSHMCGILYWLTFTGALAGSPLGTPVVTNGELVSSLTITDTLTSNDLLCAICCNGVAIPGVTVGNSRASVAGAGTSASHGGVRVATNTGSGSVSITFSTNNTDWSAATGVKIIGSSGAQDPDVPILRPRVELLNPVYRM